VIPLQERPRSYRASGARPAGPLTQPHGKRSRTRGKDVLSVGSNICGSLADEPADARGLLSGTALGLPLNIWGNPTQNLQRAEAKHASLKHTGYGPRHGGPDGPPRRPTQRSPQAGSTSLEGTHLPRVGSAPFAGVRLPRAGSASLEGPHRPRAGSASLEGAPHAHARSHTRVRAFNDLTNGGVAPSCAWGSCPGSVATTP
jgi:hypothetical protein